MAMVLMLMAMVPMCPAAHILPAYRTAERTTGILRTGKRHADKAGLNATSKTTKYKRFTTAITAAINKTTHILSSFHKALLYNMPGRTKGSWFVHTLTKSPLPATLILYLQTIMKYDLNEVRP